MRVDPPPQSLSAAAPARASLAKPAVVWLTVYLGPLAALGPLAIDM